MGTFVFKTGQNGGGEGGKVGEWMDGWMEREFISMLEDILQVEDA